jgi:anti-anti-sigma factor
MGMSKELEIDAYRQGHELFVVFRGRLILKHAQETKARLSGLFLPQVDTMYLHLGELTFLDSAGLGVLVGLKMSANKNRTRLVFLSPPPRVEDIFKVSKLDTIFEIRSGAEAEMIVNNLKKDDLCLWRDSKDVRQRSFNTEADFMKGEAPVNLTQIPGDGDSEAGRAVQKACNEAVECIKQGDYQKAISAYLRALKFEPENLSALNNLGIVYEKRPEWYPRARQIWLQVLDLSRQRGDPKHVQRAEKHLELLAKMIPDG